MRYTLILLSASLAHTVSQLTRSRPNRTPALSSTRWPRVRPVDVRVDIRQLPANERLALRSGGSGAPAGSAFHAQVSPIGTSTLLLLLGDDHRWRVAAGYFMITRDRWSSLDDESSLLGWRGPKPAGGTFLSADATREEVQAWMIRFLRRARGRARILHHDPAASLRRAHRRAV